MKLEILYKYNILRKLLELLCNVLPVFLNLFSGHVQEQNSP